MSMVAETAVAKIPSGTWSIDPAWSALEFEVRKVGLIPIKGRVPGFGGTIRGGDQTSIEGVADVSTVTTFDETRDGHLQSPDFFDAQRYPELRFRSTEVKIDGDALLVKGDLTIRGVSRPVELEGTLLGSAVDLSGNDRIGLELEGTIDRRDFGLEWNAPLPAGGLLLPNEVVLKASLAAVRTA
jgi:polyisoprenoid-binding protein YceI